MQCKSTEQSRKLVYTLYSTYKQIVRGCSVKVTVHFFFIITAIAKTSQYLVLAHFRYLNRRLSFGFTFTVVFGSNLKALVCPFSKYTFKTFGRKSSELPCKAAEW